MNRFCVVFFLALASTTLAEPPSPSYGLPSISSSYGLPSIHSEVSQGYDYKPQVISSGYDYKPSIVSTDYVQKNVGRIPSEGYNLDPQLFHKVRDILIAHENSGSKVILKPSSGYGVPQSSYGPPSHWVQPSKVVGLNFGHLSQSIPVAYYLGTDRYASGHTGWSAGNYGGSGWSSGDSGSGWSTGNSGSGWSSENVGGSGWSSGNVGSSGWSTGNSGWSKPIISVSPPRSVYGAPRW